jgi:hypothetical protein
LGHELILTADDLVYYKKASIMEMEKLYKLWFKGYLISFWIISKISREQKDSLINK